MSRKPPTKAEKAHLETVASMGCIACEMLGYPGTPAEIHHIRAGMGMGQRNNHFQVIPLCPVHHRYGKDAVHVSPATFQRKFGTELELLDRVTDKLKGAA